MDKQVIISILGNQTFAETGADCTELVTEGILKKQNYGYDLMYQESELTGMEGTHTTFQIHGGQIILQRRGGVNSEMIFEPGKKHYSLYETPYGALTIDICTSKMKWNLSESGGDIEIDYAIEIEHQVTGESQFKINVREATLPQ